MNQLIELLPRKDRLRLLDACQLVRLRRAAVLCRQGAQSRHAYFPIDGFIAMVARADEGDPGVGIGMVGRESMLGAQIVFGMAAAPLRALVQGPGQAWCIGNGALRRQLLASVALRRQLELGAAALLCQLAAAADCLHRHVIGPRLARWLLMSQDRAQTDHFHVTQEFLASMLGVRRVGITLAAGALRRGGLIDYRRGEMTVLDRSGLESAACACYALWDRPPAGLAYAAAQTGCAEAV